MKGQQPSSFLIFIIHHSAFCIPPLFSPRSDP
jgi:hypothetical protein